MLAAIAEGKSNAAIADSLVLTKRAVEKHINAIFLKLNLSHSSSSMTSTRGSKRRCCTWPSQTSGSRSSRDDRSLITRIE